MNFCLLPIKNLIRRPGRTAALLLLVVFLAFSVFGGSMAVLSLRNGLNSLEARLGADIIVVPAKVKSKINLKQTLLQDTLGEYYMPASYMGKVAEVDGVERVSAQTYLTSMTTGCCSVSIQIIGFDPETDFTVQPWINARYQKHLEPCDIVVGSSVNLAPGETIRFFDVQCRVVAKLGKTGTNMDTAAYTTNDTIRVLMAAAKEKGKELLDADDPASVISAVYVKVASGYDVEAVMARIVGHARRTAASTTRSMLSGVSESLSGVASTVTLLVIAIWLLALVILIIAFTMIANERKKEFAVLRVIGTTRHMLAGMLLRETALLSVVGGVIGIALAALVVFPFGTLIGERLALPFLLPDAGKALLLAILTLIATLIVGAAASAGTAYRLSHVDTGKILRGES